MESWERVATWARKSISEEMVDSFNLDLISV